MGAKLTIIPASGQSFDVTIRNTATIGLSDKNSVVLKNPGTSRQHAMIRRQNGLQSQLQYQLIDLGSTNGTFVDGEQVGLPVTLKNGARIKINDNLLVFSESADDEENLPPTMVSASARPQATPTRGAALLVCDILGFSTMSEKYKKSPNLVAAIMGRWFRSCGEAVTRSGGTIDKFLGDAMLAYWGSLPTDSDNCRAAMTVGQLLLKMAGNHQPTWPDGTLLAARVALHFGQVTCANVGVEVERDATIMGDAVNTVFRLEGLAKDLKEPLIFSGDLMAHLEPTLAFRKFGPQTLKGKEVPIDVFSLQNHG
jgi:adenylate cyclase